MARRKRVAAVYVQAWARHTATESEPVIIVKRTIWGGRSGDEALGTEYQTISVDALAHQLFPEPWPAVGELVDPDA